MDIKQNIPLSLHTYFHLGGPADYFVEVKSTDELIEAVAYAKEKNLSHFVLGGGSNILVTDKGFRGLVIKNKSNEIKLESMGGRVQGGGVGIGNVVVRADSGVPVNQLIAYTINQGLGGLEDLLGLPGTVGGAVYNNAHHLADLIGNHILSVELLNELGDRISVQQDQMDFRYDYSRLHKTNEIVLSACFQLTPSDKTELQKKGSAAVARRAKTQPLGTKSSGCIFQNISLADAMRIGTPNHTLSVGYLIDHAGLKGTRVGGAVVSDVHANFIVNDGTATTQNVLDLIEVVKIKVKEQYGVTIVPEVFLIGEK